VEVKQNLCNKGSTPGLHLDSTTANPVRAQVEKGLQN
jgi:hypothetical protein